MADYGFYTANLLSSSTSTFQVTFSSPQSGVIFISSSPIDLGSGGSFTFPSGATYYYFSNQQVWCINVDLSQYYVGVIVYNASTPVDFSIQVDGQTLSVSSIVGTLSCGYAYDLQMSDGLEIVTITCCSFDDTATGATTLEMSGACTCSGISSCSGCPTSGGTSSLVCSSTTPPPPSSGPTENEAFFIALPTPSTPIGNEAFYIIQLRTSVPIGNEAFYVKPVTISVQTANEAFYVQPVTISAKVQNEAFYVIQFKQVTVSITIPEYARFLSVVQAIYNVIDLNVTASVNVSQVTPVPIEIQLTPTVSVTIQQVSAPVTQTYEEQVFESFMALPALYFLSKYGIKLIRKYISRRRKKEEKK